MHKLYVGLITLIIAAMVVLPVSAMPMPPGGDDQNTGGIIVGDGNHQIVVSEHTDNNYNGETEQNAKSVVNGNGNKVNTINNNVNVNGDVTNGATSVNNNQQVAVIIPKSSAYYKMDTGSITDQNIISVYMGQVVVVPNDHNDLNHAGEIFTYKVSSTVPVLTYVVNDNEANRAIFDMGVAPSFDSYLKKFDLKNLDTIYVNQYRSPQQTFSVTIPEDGKYSLVIDTRVAQSLDGALTPITADSADLIYTIYKSNGTAPYQAPRSVIGTTDMYPISEDGHAVTTA